MNGQNSISKEFTGTQANDTIVAGSNIIRKISSSILGPKGALKLMSHPDGRISVTNDGATVLKNLLVDHAVSKIIINTSISQDWEQGDGTTSVAILTSALVEKAKAKILGDSGATNSIVKRPTGRFSLRPTDVIRGFEKASLKCQEILEKAAIKISDRDLEKLALTTLNSKITGDDSARFARMCVEAVKRISCKCSSFEVLEEIYGVETKNFRLLSRGANSNQDGSSQDGGNSNTTNSTSSNTISSNTTTNCCCEFNEDIDLKMINIIKATGPLTDSFLVPGLLVKTDTVLPRKSHPRVLAANTNLDNVKVKLAATKVEVSRVSELVEIEEKEIDRVRAKVDRMCAHSFDVVVNRQIVYDIPARRFEERGIAVIENVGFDAIERIGKLCNSMVVSSFGEDSDSSKYLEDKIGMCHEMDSIKIGKDKYARFTSCGIRCASSGNGSSSSNTNSTTNTNNTNNNNTASACSMVLFSSTPSGLEELERSIHDALCVISKAIKEKKVVLGGGALEVQMAFELQKLAGEVLGGEAAAIKIYADALLEIPRVLVKSAGGNADDVVEKLLYLRKRGYNTCGVNVNGEPGVFMSQKLSSHKFMGCMKKQEVYESYKVKQRVISAATECAQMLVKCDALIKCSTRERTRE